MKKIIFFFVIWSDTTIWLSSIKELKLQYLRNCSVLSNSQYFSGFVKVTSCNESNITFKWIYHQYYSYYVPIILVHQ
jgi:hypothetical protein